MDHKALMGERHDVLVLVEGPQGVQAAEWVVALLGPAALETLALAHLQEALLGHALFPPAAAAAAAPPPPPPQVRTSQLDPVSFFFFLFFFVL